MKSILDILHTIGASVAVFFVVLGTVPVVAGTYQIVLAGLHGLRNHYAKAEPYFPRTAIILPAWNEGLVVAASVDRLMQLDYPADSLRIYVVDDASTDDTPQVCKAKELQYPGRVFHLRREKGGEGKAHTLNHGLAVVMADDWMQALLIMDADVIYLGPSLRLMTQHLADPQVGAVTAYIKEGSRPGNYMNRFIGYEYVAAQAAARRGQNVLGVLACLAGGAQLHSRANLDAIGGRIDTSSLAEDTFTTFNTQLAGRRVVFEPHSMVLAEEPGSVVALWKQRTRWARGNVQVTWRFRRVWFRRRPTDGLGGIAFGVIWFSLFLQPFLMITSSLGLLELYFFNPSAGQRAFKFLWITAALTYVLITGMTILIDTSTGWHCWREAVLFPGGISLLLIVYALFPVTVSAVGDHLLSLVGVQVTDTGVRYLTLFVYIWPAGSMLVAWFAKVLESRPGGRWLSPLLVYVVGYGPLLCAMTLAAYIKEWRGDDMIWEKTEKSGRVMSE